MAWAKDLLIRWERIFNFQMLAYYFDQLTNLLYLYGLMAKAPKSRASLGF